MTCIREPATVLTRNSTCTVAPPTVLVEPFTRTNRPSTRHRRTAHRIAWSLDPTRTERRSHRAVR
jgi:hypothetical protein